MPDCTGSLIFLYLSLRGSCGKGLVKYRITFQRPAPLLLLWNQGFSPFYVTHLLTLPTLAKNTWGCLGADVAPPLPPFGNRGLLDFLPSLIPSFCNWHQQAAKKRHSLPHWGSALCFNTLVFEDQNKQISILGWADRKGGFMFSLFLASLSKCVFHVSDRLFCWCIFVPWSVKAYLMKLLWCKWILCCKLFFVPSF